MSDWERLYKKNKEMAKRFAGQLTEKAKDGLEQVKKGSLKNPLELRNLRLREIKLEEMILNNRERLKEYKRLELANEYVAKWDAEIHRSFYRDGGIRFYGERLLERIESLDPEQDTVEEMIVCCYNSAINDMRTLFAKLLENCDVWEKQIVAAAEMYGDDTMLKRSLGYVNCAEEIRTLYVNDNSSVDMGEELARIQEILDQNEAAVLGYMNACEARLKERPRTKAELLEALKHLIGEEDLERFGEIGTWTPQCYATEIAEYGKQVKEKLLDPYPWI